MARTRARSSSQRGSFRLEAGAVQNQGHALLQTPLRPVTMDPGRPARGALLRKFRERMPLPGSAASARGVFLEIAGAKSAYNSLLICGRALNELAGWRSLNTMAGGRADE